MIKTGMIKLDVPAYLRKEAEEHFEFKNRALKGSIREGEGNLIGALGEVMVNDFYQPHSKIDNTYDYDLIVNGKKVDVKTNEIRGGILPNSDYTPGVLKQSMFQKCDNYCFCVAPANLSVLYIAGWITKKKFQEISFFVDEGESMPLSRGKGTWTAPAPVYKVYVHQLKHWNPQSI